MSAVSWMFSSKELRQALQGVGGPSLFIPMDPSLECSQADCGSPVKANTSPRSLLSASVVGSSSLAVGVRAALLLLSLGNSHSSVINTHTFIINLPNLS